MDSKSNFELKVGIFVIIALAIFAYIVFSIGDFSVFKPGYNIKIRFGLVDGLEESSPIRYAGVEVGNVNRIDLHYDPEKKKTMVDVEGWLKKNVRIERDAQIYVNSLGIVGEKYVEILPGTKEAGYVEAGEFLIGNDSVPMEKLKQRGYEIAMKLEETIDSLNDIAGNIREGKGTLGKLLTDDSIYNNLEEFTEDIKKHPWKLMHKGREEKQKEQEAAKKGSNISHR